MYHQANNIIHGIAQQWVFEAQHMATFIGKMIMNHPYLGMEMGSKPGTSPKLDGLLENDIACSFLETIGTHL